MQNSKQNAKQNTKRKLSSFWGWLILGTIAWLTWAAWPTSVWLLLCLFMSWMLNAFAAKLHRPFDDRKRILLPLLELTLRNLAKAAGYVGIGIAIVCLAQISLLFMEQISTDALRETELFLSDARLFLHDVLGLQNLLIVLGVLVAITMLFPRSQLMAQTLKARSAFARTYLVLLGVTSFTFFSALGIRAQEEAWQKQVRYQARQALTEAEQLRREIAGVAWTEEYVKTLSPEQKQASVRFFAYSARQMTASSDVRDLARRLASAAPNAEPRGTTAQAERIAERVEAHLTSTGPIRENAPTLRQAELAVAAIQDNVARLRAIRTAAIEATAEGIANVLSDGHAPLVKAFIEELAGSLSRGALNRVVPSIDTPDAAKAWVRTNLMPTATADAGALTDAKWVWDSASFEPRVPRAIPHLIPGPGTPFGSFAGRTPYGGLGSGFGGRAPSGGLGGGFGARPPTMPTFPTATPKPSASWFSILRR